MSQRCWLTAGAALTRCFRKRSPSRIISITFAVLRLGSLAFALMS
jgi:hypothetical protein